MKDYVLETLQSLRETGTITETHIKKLSKVQIQEGKKRMFVVLEPSIADKLMPDTLSVYYWLKSCAGLAEQLDFSIKQICKMTGIKSKNKIRVAISILRLVEAISVEKNKNDVYVITLRDEETAITKSDKNLDYASRRSTYWAGKGYKLSDTIPHSSSRS